MFIKGGTLKEELLQLTYSISCIIEVLVLTLVLNINDFITLRFRVCACLCDCVLMKGGKIDNRANLTRFKVPKRERKKDFKREKRTTATFRWRIRPSLQAFLGNYGNLFSNSFPLEDYIAGD